MLFNKNKESTTLFCFSPPVMMVTFAIEIVLMIYVLVRDRASTVSKISATLLLFLAVFQLSEYSLCEGLGFDVHTWARIGFIAITMLPVLGIHLVHAVAKLKTRLLVLIAYLSAAIWFGLFAFYDIFTNFGCGANYAIFELRSPFGGSYFIYYYVWLFVGITLAVILSRKTINKYTRRALQALAIGYLVFIVPTTVINLVSRETAEAIPSIMCGFAVLFAFVLVFAVLPNYRKSEGNTKLD